MLSIKLFASLTVFISLFFSHYLSFYLSYFISLSLSLSLSFSLSFSLSLFRSLSLFLSLSLSLSFSNSLSLSLSLSLSFFFLLFFPRLACCEITLSINGQEKYPDDKIDVLERAGYGWVNRMHYQMTRMTDAIEYFQSMSTPRTLPQNLSLDYLYGSLLTCTLSRSQTHKYAVALAMSPTLYHSLPLRLFDSVKAFLYHYWFFSAGEVVDLISRLTVKVISTPLFFNSSGKATAYFLAQNFTIL